MKRLTAVTLKCYKRNETVSFADDDLNLIDLVGSVAVCSLVDDNNHFFLETPDDEVVIVNCRYVSKNNSRGEVILSDYDTEEVDEVILSYYDTDKFEKVGVVDAVVYTWFIDETGQYLVLKTPAGDFLRVNVGSWFIIRA